MYLSPIAGGTFGIVTGILLVTLRKELASIWISFDKAFQRTLKFTFPWQVSQKQAEVTLLIIGVAFIFFGLGILIQRR